MVVKNDPNVNNPTLPRISRKTGRFVLKFGKRDPLAMRVTQVMDGVPVHPFSTSRERLEALLEFGVWL